MVSWSLLEGGVIVPRSLSRSQKRRRQRERARQRWLASVYESDRAVARLILNFKAVPDQQPPPLSVHDVGHLVDVKVTRVLSLRRSLSRTGTPPSLSRAAFDRKP